MITTLSIDNTAFTPIVSDKVTGSLFRDVSLGVSLPREVTIRHQEYVDSKTKRPGRRTALRWDRYIAMSDGTIAPVSLMVIAMIPNDVNVTSAVVTDCLRLPLALHAGHANTTDIGSAVFVTGEQ